MTTINQPPGAPTVRKVRWATVAAVTSAPVAMVLAPRIVSLAPELQTAAGHQAVYSAVEYVITTALIGLPTWITGYMVKADRRDMGQ